MEITLESLGLSKEEVADRIIDKLSNSLLYSYYLDEDGNETHSTPTKFQQEMQERVISKINSSIEEIAAKHVLPNVAGYVETLCLQETSKWGEAKGKPVTFLEYLAARAEAYMTELVDFDGKGKSENNGYSWSGKQTRLTHLVHKHLHHSIETAMKDALGIVAKKVVPALETTVKIQLTQIANDLKMTVSTK